MGERRFVVVGDGLDFMVRDSLTGEDLVDAEGVAVMLNELHDLSVVENRKYHDLFDKYWDLMKKLNKIGEVIYRYNECELEE